MSSCGFLSEWGRCVQEPRKDGHCWYHAAAIADPEFRHDRFYHEKIATGLLEPSSEVLSSTEVDAMFRGRARNDGRRLDHYTFL
jgi:hypothetical protein